MIPDPVRLSGTLADLWDQALPYLDVRSNDVHSLYAFGLATALLEEIPQARPEVVLPAVLLHDTGWKTVPPEDILPAVADPAGHRQTVRRHETEGAAIAARILAGLGCPAERTARITAIIDGHDTRAHTLGPDDAVVRDADKLWRFTPHGLRTIGGWFGLGPAQTLRLVATRTTDRLFTPPARTMATTLTALAATDTSPHRLPLQDALQVRPVKGAPSRAPRQGREELREKPPTPWRPGANSSRRPGWVGDRARCSLWESAWLSAQFLPPLGVAPARERLSRSRAPGVALAREGRG